MRESNEALVCVRMGSFSGSAISLVRSLERRVRVADYDLLPLARRPSLVPYRAAAAVEALKAGRGTPWTKTGTWSRALQRTMGRAGLLRGGGPVLFIQTLPAFLPGSGVRYGIYTDRVAREGAAVGGRYRSRFTPAWLEREHGFLDGAHRVYVMGPSTKEVLISRYHLPDRKIRVVGAGPNARLGPPVRSDACRRLLFVGRQWELKGGPELLEAFSLVRREIQDLELHIVGTPPGDSVPDGVHVLGRVDPSEMGAVYSRADALVIPTRMEAFGLALLEGLMMGVPCIASTVGNQPWIVRDAGICVEPGDVKGLAEAILKLVSGYPDWKERALVRGELLRKLFSWEAVADAILPDLVAGYSWSPDRPGLMDHVPLGHEAG